MSDNNPSQAGVESGHYRYAATVKQTMDDPVNSIEKGTITIVAGKCDDGVIRTVIDEETEGFVDITGEVIEHFHADTRMQKDDIKSWAVTQANKSDIDYSTV